MKKLLGVLFALFTIGAANAQSATFPFTIFSKVKEANPRVVAIAIEFDKVLSINWKLANAFQVTAELLPVKSYGGDLIANSAAAKAPRMIKKAYTSAKAETGSPSQGKYVIIEMDPEDYNASSWYLGFSPGIRQVIAYKDNMVYEIKLLYELNYFAPDVTAGTAIKPGGTVETVKTDSVFKMASTKIVSVDDFVQGIHTEPSNAVIKSIGYNFYKPTGLAEGAKAPLVVFLHGSGQSHDYLNFPGDLSVDTISPLLANQGGITWVENARKKCFVLVPQVPARDTMDAAGEIGWRNAETEKLVLNLLDKLITENPSIDTNRLYLTGLSLGAMGSWKIITNPDPAISMKFAAAVIICGSPKLVRFAASDTPAQKDAKFTEAIKPITYKNVKIPLWLFHCDTDPAVNRLGSRIPFAILTGKATIDSKGELVPASGTLKIDDGSVKYYVGKNKAGGNEVRYTEYQYGDGTKFRNLGMVTQNGHFSWEIVYKDQMMMDWMFKRVKKTKK
jgi:predicted peptidase